MSGHAFRMDMGNLISVSAQSASPSYTITHAQRFMFWGAVHVSIVGGNIYVVPWY